MKFPKISALLGLKSDSEALTDAHMTAAEATLGALQDSQANLTTQLATATGELTTAKADLATAAASLTTTTAELTTAKNTVETLEKWKKEQAVVDGREEDESTKADRVTAPKAAFELEAEAHIERVRKNLQ